MRIGIHFGIASQSSFSLGMGERLDYSTIPSLPLSSILEELIIFSGDASPPPFFALY